MWLRKIPEHQMKNKNCLKRILPFMFCISWFGCEKNAGKFSIGQMQFASLRARSSNKENL